MKFSGVSNVLFGIDVNQYSNFILQNTILFQYTAFIVACLRFSISRRFLSIIFIFVFFFSSNNWLNRIFVLIPSDVPNSIKISVSKRTKNGIYKGQLAKEETTAINGGNICAEFELFIGMHCTHIFFGTHIFYLETEPSMTWQHMYHKFVQ